MNQFIKSLALLLLLSFSLQTIAADDLAAGIRSIQKEWAEIHYRTPKDKKVDKLVVLVKQTKELGNRYPTSAEPLIWQAISLGTYAGAMGGIKTLFESLPAVKDAKVALEKAIQLDPQALNGAGPTTMGSFYYQVPGWPLAYGNKDKARALLKQGLAISPDDVDANYFYGDFLLEQKEYKKAAEAMKKALGAPARPGRALADEGRKKQARQKLNEIKTKL